MHRLRSGYSALALISTALVSALSGDAGPAPYPAVAPRVLPPATAAPAALEPGQELVVNGSFEKNGVDGWLTSNVGFGSMYVTRDTTGFYTGLPLFPAPDGEWQVAVDQPKRGRHLFLQDIFIPENHTAELSFIVWVVNYADDYHDAGTLEYREAANQQVRVDLIDRLFGFEDVGAGVLLQAFQTKPGDPSVIPPTLIRHDVTPLAGRVVRLRIAEVDNQNHLNAGFDAFSIRVTPATPAVATSWGRLKADYR